MIRLRGADVSVQMSALGNRPTSDTTRRHSGGGLAARNKFSDARVWWRAEASVRCYLGGFPDEPETQAQTH